jgi:hypothetical protein
MQNQKHEKQNKRVNVIIYELMDIFDHQLGRIMSFVYQNQNTVLIVASSME